MRRGSKKNRLLDYWAGIPALNLAATFHRRRSKPSRPPKKIGVMCSPALGDTLLFSAALQDIRAAYTHAEIVHCCMGPNKGAAAIIPGADRRIVIDLTRPDKSIQLVRPERFDYFVDYTSWQRLTAFIVLMSGARFTAGFRSPGMYRSRGYDLTADHTNDRHELENFRALSRALGIPTSHEPALSLQPDPDLSQVWPHGFGNPVILFHLWASGANSHLREWPQERWLQLAAALRERLPGVIFGVTGTSAELPQTEPFIELMRNAGLEAYPIIATFGELAELAQRSTLVVSVNTGVMHLAAIAGAATISLNGPTSNVRWGPLGPRSLGVQPAGTGCGYLNYGFEFAGQPSDCMERISVESVLAACDRVLKM